MTSPATTEDRRSIDWLLTIAVVAVTATFIRAIFFTPAEARQGLAQKIFYVHAPSAFIALYVAFGIVAVAGALYLWLRDERLDRVAASAAEVGVVFMTVVLVTGPMWGKPIWGTWWTWDARLTLTLFLWFVFLGYLILRGAIEDHDTRARYSAVLGVFVPSGGSKWVIEAPYVIAAAHGLRVHLGWVVSAYDLGEANLRKQVKRSGRDQDRSGEHR